MLCGCVVRGGRLLCRCVSRCGLCHRSCGLGAWRRLRCRPGGVLRFRYWLGMRLRGFLNLRVGPRPFGLGMLRGFDGCSSLGSPLHGSRFGLVFVVRFLVFSLIRVEVVSAFGLETYLRGAVFKTAIVVVSAHVVEVVVGVDVFRILVLVELLALLGAAFCARPLDGDLGG